VAESSERSGTDAIDGGSDAHFGPDRGPAPASPTDSVEPRAPARRYANARLGLGPSRGAG